MSKISAIAVLVFSLSATLLQSQDLSDPTALIYSNRIQEIERTISADGFIRNRQHASLSGLICEGLAQADRYERSNFAKYLRTSSRWINASSYEKCFTKSSDLFGDDYSYILDNSQFIHLNRESRIEIIRTCIAEGGVDLWRGIHFPKVLCIGMAAFEGDESLMDSSLISYQSLSSKEKSILPLGAFRANHELAAGSLGGEDAQKVALQRLSDMGTEALQSRLQSDAGFARAVTGLTQRSCEKAWDPQCRSIFLIFQEVSAFYLRTQAPDQSLDTLEKPQWWVEIAPLLQPYETLERTKRYLDLQSSM